MSVGLVANIFDFTFNYNQLKFFFFSPDNHLNLGTISIKTKICIIPQVCLNFFCIFLSSAKPILTVNQMDPISVPVES